MTTPSWEREGQGDDDQILETNWLFELRRERFRSRKSGKSHAYYVVKLADAVNVIATTTNNELVMVRQFRAGSATDSLETPGGLLEKGEDPLEAGARELLEETGYQGGRASLVGTAYANASILSSKIFTIAIENVEKVASPDPDPDEELSVELVPVETLAESIEAGRFDHALALLGMLWWLAKSRGFFKK